MYIVFQIIQVNMMRSMNDRCSRWRQHYILKPWVSFWAQVVALAQFPSYYGYWLIIPSRYLCNV